MVAVFCGCGTALVAAQRLKRQWIGIDISPTACRVMAKRLKDKRWCGLWEDEALWAIGRGFIVRDLPKTEEELRKYPHTEFENWAVIALGGIKNKVQVGDKGIDGRIFPVGAEPAASDSPQMHLTEHWYPIQVPVKLQNKTRKRAELESKAMSLLPSVPDDLMTGDRDYAPIAVKV